MEMKVTADKEFVKRLYNELETQERIIQEQLIENNARLEDWLKNEVANATTPPIKGEVTRSKLKWRGVRMIVCVGKYVAAEQRGKEIARFIIE